MGHLIGVSDGHKEIVDSQRSMEIAQVSSGHLTGVSFGHGQSGLVATQVPSAH